MRMKPELRKIVAIIAGAVLVISVFLPALDIGFASLSLWDGMEGNQNGNGIVILIFGLLTLVAAIAEKYDYVQACAMGVFAVTLSLVIDLFRADAAEYIGIGIILLVLFSIVGVGIKEIKLK